MKKLILTIFLCFFAFSSFSGQKVIEKGIMEVTDDKTGEVKYKILWRVPDGKDSFWINAVHVGSSDAYSGDYPVDAPNAEPLPAITIGDYVATEEGMKRAVRAIADVYRAANKSSGGNNSSSGSSC